MIEIIHIKDVLKSGLFASINYNIPDFTFDELDMLFNMKYGERIISPSVKALLNDENVLTPENMQLLGKIIFNMFHSYLIYTSPSPRDRTRSRMPSSA